MVNDYNILLPDFYSSDVISGLKEGVAVMYHPSSYPYQAIGPVWLLWQPKLKILQFVKLWVWSHPSTNDEIYRVLLSLAPSTEPVDKENPLSDSTHSLTITLLKDQLIRFRLIGLQSLPALLSILYPPDSNQYSQTEPHIDPEGLYHLKSLSKWTELSKTSQHRQWWLNDIMPDHAHQLSQEYDIIKESCDQFPIGSIVTMVTRDPRLYIPEKKTNLGCPPPKETEQTPPTKLLNLLGDIEEESSDQEEMKENAESADEDKPEETTDQIDTEENVELANEDEIDKDALLIASVLSKPLSFPTSVVNSPLWNPVIRKSVSDSKLPDHVINEVRGKFFLKPDQTDLGAETCHVPVMLIKRSYPSKPHPLIKHTFTGWDIVLPRNWAMAFWISLIYQGCRPCGLQELVNCCNIECLEPNFPSEYPDTLAGQGAGKDERTNREERYARYPPDKRPNFGKLKVPTPFHVEWEELVNNCKRMRFENGSCSEIMLLEEPLLPDSLSKKPRLDLESAQSDVVTMVTVDQPPQMDMGSSSPYYVLRSSKALEQLSQFHNDLFKTRAKPHPPEEANSTYFNLVTKYGIDKILQEHDKSLVTLTLEIATHGTLTSHSTLSMPLPEDLVSYMSDKRYLGPVESLAPRGVTFVEGGVVYIGVYQMTRKEMKELKKERQRVSRKTKKEKVTKDSKMESGMSMNL